MVHVDVATWRRLAGSYEFLEPLVILLKGKVDAVVHRLAGSRRGWQASDC